MDRPVQLETSDSAGGLSRLSLLAAAIGLAAVVAVAASRVVRPPPGPGSAAVPPSPFEAPEPAKDAFWSHWGDGKAELAGYRLRQPRYGELREGQAVYVFVTEPFSHSARVKADPGRHPESDVFQVMKLNAIEDFQTGVYDYNLMTSVFVPVTPHPEVRLGHPTKIAFSSQEWCGMLFERLELGPARISRARFSYFDGEGEARDALAYPAGGLTVDEMPIFVRGFLGAPLDRGESVEVPVLPSVKRARLLHRDLEWTRGRLSRSAEPREVEVPAGRFEVDAWELALERGETYRYLVETEAPHRLVAWEGPDGASGRLTGVTRLPYWRLSAEGDERHLEALGLERAAAEVSGGR